MSGTPTPDELERRIERIEDRIEVFCEKLDSIRDLLVKFQIEHARIVHCPAPGSCLQLGSRVSKLEDNFTYLHNLAQQAKGGWKVIGGVSGAIGAAIVMLLQFALNHWTK